MASATNVFTRERASAPASAAAFASGSIRATLGESFTIRAAARSCARIPQPRQAGRIAGKEDAAVLGIGTRDVELVGGDALGVFQHPDDFDVILDGVAEHVGEDRGAGAAQLGQLFGDKGPDADVLQADGVDHAGPGLPDTRRRVAVHGLAGETLDHDAPQSGQIDQILQFHTVGEGAGGGQHRGLKRNAAQRSSQAGRHFVTE